jgi:SIR2-like domain
MLLFLGSGVSLASGLPSVLDITEELLEGKFYYDTVERGKFYHENEINGKIVKDVTDIQIFLKILKKIDTHYLKTIAPYYTGNEYKNTGSIYRSVTSYEDIFNLTQQVQQNGVGLTDDAMIGTFVDFILKEDDGLLEGNSREQRLISLYHLSSKSLNFIEWLVSKALHPKRLEGLDLLTDLAISPHIERLDIVTLNHDTLVEQLFTKNEIPYVDGFGNKDGDFRLFDDKLYDAKDARIRIFKPHGSVEWYSVLGVEYPAIYTGTNIQDCRLGNGKQLQILTKTPAFLSGVNKVVSYNRGIYAEMFYRVHQAFKENQFVVMSGYGWGDTAINFRIMNWLGYTQENKILLLHQNPEELMDRSLQLSESYGYLIESNRLILLKQWLSEVKIAEVEKFILEI